jgi:hypothetical protein
VRRLVPRSGLGRPRLACHGGLRDLRDRAVPCSTMLIIIWVSSAASRANIGRPHSSGPNVCTWRTSRRVSRSWPRGFGWPGGSVPDLGAPFSGSGFDRFRRMVSLRAGASPANMTRALSCGGVGDRALYTFLVRASRSRGPRPELHRQRLGRTELPWARCSHATSTVWFSSTSDGYSGAGLRFRTRRPITRTGGLSGIEPRGGLRPGRSEPRGVWRSATEGMVVVGGNGARGTVSRSRGAFRGGPGRRRVVIAVVAIALLVPAASTVAPMSTSAPRQTGFFPGSGWPASTSAA